MKDRLCVLTAAEAVECIQSGQVISAEGFAFGFCFPEELAEALEQRFFKTGNPRELTLYFGAGPGDTQTRGFNHFSHAGLVKKVIGSHFALNKQMQQLILNEEAEGYSIPLGVAAQSFRNLAGGNPFVISHVGLGTFCDPRYGGGRLNESARHDVSEVIHIDDREYLLYRIPNIDVALIRGTYCDEDGNVSFDKEVVPLTALSMAQACHNNGGTVIVQVEKIVKRGSIHPKNVVIPGILVDIVVPASEGKYQMMNFYNEFDPSYVGDIQEVLDDFPANINDKNKRIIAERAFQELKSGMIVNLGIGVPEYIAAIAKEHGTLDKIMLTVEGGIIGGAVQSGTDFACSKNPEALVGMASMFDFYDGGGLDIAYLGFAEIDKDGNVNVSRMGNLLPGVGGFINISQTTKKVVFTGTMTARSGQIKFKRQVEQISFNGQEALKRGQEVLYITEKAVFKLTKQGLRLMELLPGADLQRDVLELMEFEPLY